MKTELKGWLADNTVTTDNKEDKILVLESPVLTEYPFSTNSDTVR